MSAAAAGAQGGEPQSTMPPEVLGDVADVTNSTAFMSIDSQLEEGRLVEERATHLKAKYKELHDRVLQIYNHDNFLLKRARQSKKDLESEKAKVERCGEVARTDDSQIQTLKKSLAEVEHELSIAQEKESMLQVEALELERKKQNLTHEVEDAVAAEEARQKPRIEDLSREINAIGMDMNKMSEQLDKLKDQREALLAKEAQIRDQMAKQATVIYDTKLEFTRIEREPDRARKQADIVVKAHQTALKELNSILDKIAAQTQLLNDLEEKKRALNAENCDLWATLQTNTASIDSRNRQLKHMNDDLDGEKEQNAKQQMQVQKLEDGLEKASSDLNKLREDLNKALRDKDQGMKTFKRIDQARADLQSEREIFLKQSEMLHREEQRLLQTRRECSTELEELKRDVDILINNFLKEEIAEKRCVLDKEAIQAEIKTYEKDVSQKSAEEQALKREAADLSIKREQMSRESSRNQAKVALARNELKVKEVVVRELKKRHDELSTRLRQLVEMYSSVKRERSAKAALIQSASQMMSETMEKIKILENELEVLRRESLIKDQELAKKRRESHEMRQTCKNLRVEKNKCRRKLEGAVDHERDLKQQMGKLNSIITLTEDEMLTLKKAYEDAVENRNYTGIQLIDRNDELCILYEKANIQENILKRGSVMLNQREDEIRSTAVELANIQREIDICQKVLPEVRDMEEDLAQMLQDLEDERWRADALEKDLTDPANASRWRNLGKVGAKGNPSSSVGGAAASTSLNAAAPGGSQPSPSKSGKEGQSQDGMELQQKQQELEQRLATVTEKLMEKDLVLEEVTELSNELRKKALSGRDFTLKLAKRVNTYQFGIKNKTKKMMATLSELSMVQASSIKLEMDVDQMEEQVRISKDAVQQGEPPSEEVAYNFEKEEADKARRKEMLLQRKERLKAEAEQVSMRTKAEARPNAYIPLDSDLAISKPYGSHAPFKPTTDAQHNIHRFYRKTQVRELDIED